MSWPSQTKHDSTKWHLPDLTKTRQLETTPTNSDQIAKLQRVKLNWAQFFYIRIEYLRYFALLRSSKTCCRATEVLYYHLWQLLFLRSLFMSLLCREYNLGKGSNNQNGNLRWHLPWRGGGLEGVSSATYLFWKMIFVKNHLESFPDCENVFCT